MPPQLSAFRPLCTDHIVVNLAHKHHLLVTANRNLLPLDPDWNAEGFNILVGRFPDCFPCTIAKDLKDEVIEIIQPSQLALNGCKASDTAISTQCNDLGLT